MQSKKTVFVKSRLIFHCKVQSVHNVGNKQNLKTKPKNKRIKTVQSLFFISSMCGEFGHYIQDRAEYT